MVLYYSVYTWEGDIKVHTIIIHKLSAASTKEGLIMQNLNIKYEWTVVYKAEGTYLYYTACLLVRFFKA